MSNLSGSPWTLLDFRMAAARFPDFLHALESDFEGTKRVIRNYFVQTEGTQARWVDVSSVAKDCWLIKDLSKHYYYMRGGHFAMVFPFWRYHWGKMTAAVDFSTHASQESLRILFGRTDLFSGLDLMRCRMVCKDWHRALKNELIWQQQCERMDLEPVFYKDFGHFGWFQRFKIGSMCNFRPEKPTNAAVTRLHWSQIRKVAQKRPRVLSVFSRHRDVVGKVELRKKERYLEWKSSRWNKPKRCIMIARNAYNGVVFRVSTAWHLWDKCDRDASSSLDLVQLVRRPK